MDDPLQPTTPPPPFYVRPCIVHTTCYYYMYPHMWQCGHHSCCCEGIISSEGGPSCDPSHPTVRSAIRSDTLDGRHRAGLDPIKVSPLYPPQTGPSVRSHTTLIVCEGTLHMLPCKPTYTRRHGNQHNHQSNPGGQSAQGHWSFCISIWELMVTLTLLTLVWVTFICGPYGLGGQLFPF